MKLDSGLRFLADNGLNLFAALALDSLSASVVAALRQAQVATQNYSHLILLGNGGRHFWQVFAERSQNGPDPIDAFSIEIAKRFADDFLGVRIVLLYPSDSAVPLQQLGALAGWHYPSPLGLGIHPQYGLWFAYRVLFLVRLPLGEFFELPDSPPGERQSPCASCADKPCISACPAQAVSARKAFDIAACSDFRLRATSLCSERCLARLACPVGREHRYSTAQTRYHYRRSLQALKRYRAEH